MGYPPRRTFGWCECRPREFQSTEFPKPSLICSKNCIYYIFCNLELKQMTLGDRIKEIRLILQRPYHIFACLPNGSIILILENEAGQRLSFSGDTIVGAVKTAEEYIEHERKMGSLKPKEGKAEKEEEPRGTEKSE